MNPYEPPQTIDTPPPVAQPAPTIWPSAVQPPQLPRTAGHCAWAGQLLLLAALVAVVFVMSESPYFAGLVSVELAKNLKLMCGLSLGLLLVGGWFKNMIGQLLFVQLVQDRETAGAYRMLFVLNLVKVSLLAASCFVLFHLANEKLKFLLFVVLILFVFLLFHTILLQAKTLRRWQMLLARPLSRGLLESYKYLNIGALVLIGSQIWYWFQEQHEPEKNLVIVALLLFAGAMVAYTKLYRQLQFGLEKGAS